MGYADSLSSQNSGELMAQLNDYSNHFRELVELQLPDGSRVLVPSGGPDMMILATWRLSNDTVRPNKRSRMIRLVISQEALEDYACGSHGARQASDERLTHWLTRQLSGFDPNHDAPLGVEPPAVTWPIDTLVLNG
jgi:hypothetical protein